MSCVCGHSEEEHPNLEACEGEVPFETDGSGKKYKPCICVAYEADETAEEESAE